MELRENMGKVSISFNIPSQAKTSHATPFPPLANSQFAHTKFPKNSSLPSKFRFSQQKMDFDVTSIIESADAIISPKNGLSAENKTSMPAEQPEEEQMLPPEHLFSDYIEIAYLGAVIIAGLALNFCVLKRLIRERRMEERSGRPKNGFVLLKLNLNISDLLILLIHATGKFGWLITYEWRGGEHLCRLFNFLSMFTLYLSSNIVICIAVDRLMTVLKAQKLNTGKRKLNLVRLMLLLAWSFSILFSLPQLFVWTTYNPFRLSNSQGWVQCTDIWSIDRYERYLGEQSGKKGEGTPRKGWANFVLSTAVQNGYELAHLFLVFYGPLIALIFCYALISTRLIRFAANNPRNSTQQATSNENAAPYSAIVPENRRQYCKRASVKSFPAVKLYAPLADRRRRKSHHSNVPMIDIHEVSTRAEETSSSEQQSCVQNFQKCCQIDEADTTTPMMNGGPANCKHRSSNNSLPIYGGIRSCRKEIADDEFPGPKTVLVHSPHLHSCSSNSSISTVAFQNGKQQKQRRILVRLRDSFRNSFNQRLRQPAGHQLNANLAFHCSAASLNAPDHQCQKGKEKEKDGLLWGNIWHRLANLNIWKRKKGDEEAEGGSGHDGLPPPIGPQNGLCRQSTVNHSIRSSFSTTATVGPLGRAESRAAGAALPLWRRHLRSRAFRATLLVILAHVLLWSPYNVYALMKHVNERMYERMSEQANVLKDLQFLIVLINPFLYGFGRRVQNGKERGGGGVEKERTGGL